ncbi:MAG: helix-turn-helix domain-containing protein [Nitrospirota bacterium]
MSEKLLRVEELAEMLNLKPSSIYQLVFKRKIPCIKISRRAVRFELNQILKWLESKAQQPGAEPVPVPKPVRRSTRRKRSGRVTEESIRSMIENIKKEVLSHE